MTKDRDCFATLAKTVGVSRFVNLPIHSVHPASRMENGIGTYGIRKKVRVGTYGMPIESADSGLRQNDSVRGGDDRGDGPDSLCSYGTPREDRSGGLLGLTLGMMQCNILQ